MSDIHKIRNASRQQQFLSVISRDDAVAQFQQHLDLQPLGTESVSLEQSHGRVLAADVIATIDVPAFDRSNVDGFALLASDVAGASEDAPRTLNVNHESLLPGVVPAIEVQPGTATPISTGGIVPRGADAILMIEDSHLVDRNGTLTIEISRSVAAGQGMTFAGSDIAMGETMLWVGQLLTSREIGVMASLGCVSVTVYRRPRVAILSTGDEVVPPGDPLPLGSVYDSNAAILSAAVHECGGQSINLGRVRDDVDELRTLFGDALQKNATGTAEYDLILLSGGTSKGAGDLSYRVIGELTDPGIVAHGVALKPGKPICLAVTNGKPVVVLPGFPTSAIFTFHEFVATVIRAFAGLPPQRQSRVSASLPMKINSDRGRTEYALVRLLRTERGLTAFPMGKGSGSVTTFSEADGFITIPQHQEMLSAGETVQVTLLDRIIEPADLVVVGSHCTGLDYLLGLLRQQGLRVTRMNVGSQAGLLAVQRGEADLAGIHLLDPHSNTYNVPFLADDVHLIRGYDRMQSLVISDRTNVPTNANWIDALDAILSDPALLMVNRNPGSGTRILTDQLLQSRAQTGSMQPRGYGMQVKSHNAVAAAIKQGRADCGIAIESVAKSYHLSTIPIRAEQFDFAVRADRQQIPAVQRFMQLLSAQLTRDTLQTIGFCTTLP